MSENITYRKLKMKGLSLDMLEEMDLGDKITEVVEKEMLLAQMKEVLETEGDVCTLSYKGELVACYLFTKIEILDENADPNIEIKEEERKFYYKLSYSYVHPMVEHLRAEMEEDVKTEMRSLCFLYDYEYIIWNGATLQKVVKQDPVGPAIVLGVAVGIVVGLATQNIWIGLGSSAVCGTLAGIIVSKRYQKQKVF